MADSALKQRIVEDMKSAMRAKDKERLATVRSILAVIKQQEVDTRKDVDDKDIIALLDKMCKQRKDSIEQYTAAQRDDLVAIEQKELEIIQTYLPEQMSDAEIDALIAEAISETGADSMKDMGKVMAFIRPKAQGRADMGQLSGKVKETLIKS